MAYHIYGSENGVGGEGHTLIQSQASGDNTCRALLRAVKHKSCAVDSSGVRALSQQTALFYNLCCANVSQPVPSLFRVTGKEKGK